MSRSVALAFASVVLAVTYFVVPTPGPSQAADAAPQNKTAPDAAAAEVPAPQMEKKEAKRLHTVPEDDLVKDHSIPPKFVRELIAARSKEDLIICMAGCSPRRDRVLYAQPIEASPETASLTAPTSETTPAKAELAPASIEAPTTPQPSAATSPRIINAPLTTIQ